MSKLEFPDALEIVQKHVVSLQQLPPEVVEAVEATFVRQAELIRARLYGVDVGDEQRAVTAQLLQIESGAAATLQAHWWAAATEYAEKLGEVAVAFVKGLVIGSVK